MVKPKTIYVRTLPEMAVWFGVSIDAINQWRAKGAPDRKSKGYDVREWALWRIARADISGRSPIPDEHKDIRRELDRVKLEKARGLVVSVAEAEAERLELVKAFVGVCDRGVGELPRKLAGKPLREGKAALKAWFDDRRREIVRKGTKGGPGHRPINTKG